MSVNATGQSVTRRLLPETHLLLCWIISLVAFAIFSHFGLQVDVADTVIVMIAHVVCLPLLSPRLDSTVVASLGLVVVGLAIGCELMDLCFDFLIHWDTPLKIGDRTISAREVGFLYYNTILKGKHVNFAIEIFLLTSQFGALVGSSRSSAKVRQAWFGMVLTMISGNGFYLTTVVTRYVDLRLAHHFEERFFDGWSRVIAARLFLLMHLFIAVFLLCSILVKMQQQAWKCHEK